MKTKICNITYDINSIRKRIQERPLKRTAEKLYSVINKKRKTLNTTMIQPLQQKELNEKASEECNRLNSDINVDSRVTGMVTRAKAKKDDKV